MKKSYLKVAASLLTAMALTSAAYAVKMVGEINLSGLGAIALTNDFGAPGVADLSNADKINFPSPGPNAFGMPNTASNAIVAAGSGTFAAMGGTLGIIQDFGFNPVLTPSPVAPLWTLTNGFSFALDAITMVDQGTPGFLNLTGVGRFAGGMFEVTEGTWSFTVTTTGTLFTWTNGQSTVPEGGSTLALLGAALIAVAALRRRSGKA